MPKTSPPPRQTLLWYPLHPICVSTMHCMPCYIALPPSRCYKDNYYIPPRSLFHLCSIQILLRFNRYIFNSSSPSVALPPFLHHHAYLQYHFTPFSFMMARKDRRTFTTKGSTEPPSRRTAQKGAIPAKGAPGQASGSMATTAQATNATPKK